MRRIIGTTVKRAPAIMLVIAALLGVVAAGAAVRPSWTEAPVEVGLERAAPTTTTTTTSTTTTTTTTPPPPTTAAATAPLPRPVMTPPPPREPVIQIGRIQIPKLGLDAPLHEGVSLRVINHGPSHWPGTALPGEIGNVVVAGHRTTYTKPFRHIDSLVPGDQVIFEHDGVRWVYETVGSEVVTPDGTHILNQTREKTATLFACHPPGSARYRYVVHLRLVGPEAPAPAG